MKGKPLTETEREIQTYLGGLTGLFDDLFDEKNIEEDRLLKMIRNPDESQSKSSFELLFLRFYLKALSLANKKPIIELLEKCHLAQIASKEQTKAELSQERITEITREKGGVSIQFYRAGFDGEPSNEENEMLYNLGSVGQLENDIFDIHKDFHDGIKTLSTTHNSIQELKLIYDSWIKKYDTSLEKLNVNNAAKKEFSRFTRILYLRGQVCLNQLIQVENKMGGKLNVSKCEREALICDMGKTTNQLRLLKDFLFY